jgi:phospho-N-acetylmuramoyl-pentapeptide-transferase
VIYYLFQSQFEHGGQMLRMIAAAGLSFLVVLLLGPRMIRFLIRRKLGDRPEFNNVSLNELTKDKSRTPTMGGVLILLAIFVGVVMFANLGNMYVRLGLMVLVWLGGLGACDDWLKLHHKPGSKSRDGLKTHEKLLFQIGLAVLVSIFVYKYGSASTVVVEGQKVNPAHSFYFPFIAAPVAIGGIAHAIITVLTMTGSSNAVNLTDGMDGLACGNMIICTAVMGVVSWVVGVQAWSEPSALPTVAGAAEMVVLCGAMIGACLGFLWYNCHPAQVFMGDTGSLPLGGLLGFIAVVTRQELLLVIAGGVFVMEALSVMMQVSYYKLTKGPNGREGKRILRCAPIHHHFHLGGWAESKVVVRFWILGMVLAAIALATLKLRFGAAD